MSRAAHSVAITEQVEAEARRHLLRADEQEDICFALWHPSTGRSRITALVERLILPLPGERNLHGNASFNSEYLERALTEAVAAGAGLAMMHSHPHGRGWQDMSADDIRAEQGNAGAVFGATGRPFVGLTLAGNGAWSARFWARTAPRTYPRASCATVRIVGEKLTAHYMDQLARRPKSTAQQVRTISAWGAECQAHLARLRIGVIGAGSVGGVVADALGRIGIEDVMTLDFDFIETHNLDRLLYATRADVGRLKVQVLSEHLEARATASPFRVEGLPFAIYEEEGFRAALDCDFLISCVDRPWGRQVLNLIAYAHLIPVVDGGVAVRTNRLGKLAGADWRAHTATVGRPCLECLGQYDPAFVQLERQGMLDDPSYIGGLPPDHPLKMRENVYPFALSCGSFQLLQALAYIVAPLGLSNPGPQLYHFVGGFMEPPEPERSCEPSCLFHALTAKGYDCGYVVTGPRPTNLPQSVKRFRPTDGKGPRGYFRRVWDSVQSFLCRLSRKNSTDI